MAEESVIVASDEGHISDSMTEGASARTSGSYSSKRPLTDSDRRSLVKNEETACSIESNSESPSTSSGRERLPINVMHTKENVVCNHCKKGEMSVDTPTDSERGSTTKTATARGIFNCEDAVLSFRNDQLNPNVILFSAIASAPLFIAMITVGSLYNDDQYCKIAIPHCLIAMGGVGLCFAILSMLSVLCGSAGITILRILSGVTRLVILIWASVEIFGPYKHWQYDENQKEDEYYCQYTPFMFGFIVLISNWVLLAMQMNCKCTGRTICLDDYLF